MFFNDLCKIAEQSPQGQLSEFLRVANRFVVPDSLPLDDRNIAETPEELLSTFTLPFTECTVEIEDSVCLIGDTLNNQIGFSSPRFVSTYEPFSPPKNGEVAPVGFPEKGNLTTLAAGVLEGDKHSVFFNIKRIQVFNNLELFADLDIPAKTILFQDQKGGVPIKEGDQFIDEYREIITKSIMSRLAVFLFLGSTKHFVVEERPKKVIDPFTSKKIPRAHQRSEFTLLTPDQIRKTYDLTEGEGTHSQKVTLKSPHERRRHKRVLRHERFGDNIGKVIDVAACWVGPTTAVKGNKIYIVRYDL